MVKWKLFTVVIYTWPFGDILYSSISYLSVQIAFAKKMEKKKTLADSKVQQESY